MKRPSFIEPLDLWDQDGSLRDVYIHDASVSDWLALFAVVARYPHQYYFDGESRSLPSYSSVFANRDGSHALAITVGEAVVYCHFFVTSEIELDVDPREVLTAITHEQVLVFLETLACECGKALSLTAENSPESPLLSYEPTSAEWSIHPPQYQGLALRVIADGA